MDDNKFIKIGIGVIIVFLFGYFLRLAKPVLVPFFLAVLLSFALSPVLDSLAHRKIPKFVALGGILLLTFIVICLIGILFYFSGKTLASELPSYNDMIKSILGSVDQSIHNARLKMELMNWINNLSADKAGSLILTALGSFVYFMSELLLVLVFMVFLLAGRGRMERKIVAALSQEGASTLSRAIRKIDHQIQRYLAVITLVNLIIGVLVAVVATLFRLPFALVFGVLTFLLNYIPRLGSVIATALPVFLAAFYFPTMGPAIGLLIIVVAVHFVLGDIVQPRMLGKDLGLSPLLVLFSLFFGAWLWGVEGTILAVPILAILKIIFSNIASLRVLETLMEA
jgi:AI-2 transport protein TqsA